MGANAPLIHFPNLGNAETLRGQQGSFELWLCYRESLACSNVSDIHVFIHYGHSLFIWDNYSESNVKHVELIKL